MAAKSGVRQILAKAATGIAGFDEISLGGLPRNRTTLVMGGPGTGKSVFALQSLVGAIRKSRQTAIFVAFGPVRWTPWVGLVVPLVLGLGAILAAVMTCGFIDQLTDIGNPGLLVGSVMHVIGLTAAIAAGLAMVLSRRGPGRA